MPEFNPEQFKQNEENNINPLLNQKKSSKPNPLAGHFRQAKIYITLPSEGKYYPENSLGYARMELPVMPMTTKPGLALKTRMLFLIGLLLDLIHSCIPNIKNAWGMPSLDIDACLIAIGHHGTWTNLCNCT